MTEYPAAHSMDASWFMLDKCGHIAEFNSGEDGAILSRVESCSSQDIGSVFEELLKEDPKVVVDLLEGVHEKYDRRFMAVRTNGDEGKCLVTEAALRREGIEVLGVTDEAIVIRLYKSGEFAERMHEEKLCIGCTDGWRSLRGMFQFGSRGREGPSTYDGSCDSRPIQLSGEAVKRLKSHGLYQVQVCFNKSPICLRDLFGDVVYYTPEHEFFEEHGHWRDEPEEDCRICKEEKEEEK